MGNIYFITVQTETDTKGHQKIEGVKKGNFILVA